jgi:hypothetical protein
VGGIHRRDPSAGEDQLGWRVGRRHRGSLACPGVWLRRIPPGATA